MFSISGRRPQDNLFLLNGVEYTGASLINVTPGGTSGQLLGVDAVREFNVVTDTYSASYGKRQGAQISIVTASGTNSVHGSAYEFIRNSALDARNYFDQAQIPTFQRNNFGGSLGGPIRTDKLFLFANYEGYRQNLGLSDVTLVPDNASRAPRAVASVKPLLDLWPVQNGPELGSGIAYAYSSPIQHIREDFGTTRFDYNISPKDLFFAVYTIDDSMANTPSANPYSLVNETLREQVLSIQCAACLLADAAEHCARRLQPRRLLLYRLHSLRYQRKHPRLGRGQTRGSHRHRRLYRLERRFADYRRWGQCREQQHDCAQPVHV